MDIWTELNWENSPSGLPMFKRIAEAIAVLIRNGQLAPGQQLPSSRKLALLLNVHRNTILASYDELLTQGYLQAQKGRGTYVNDDLQVPEQHASQVSMTRQVRLRLGAAPRPHHPLNFAANALPLLGGLPDLRLVPTEALARAYRAALKNEKGATLEYRGLLGHPRFIAAFSNYLRQTRGVRVAADEMCVTRGSQQALHLAARALCRPGCVIAVERAGYPPAWEAFRLAGCSLVPVNIDEQGLVVDDLAAACRHHEVAAVYVTPHHQYPTTATLSAGRRLELLALAKKKRFVVIEDDYDHEFHFDTRPILPLKSLDEHGVVLHIGTLSKVFAPGLRLGYAVGQKSLIDLMAQNRAYIDRQGDATLELALSYLIEDGELGAHMRRMFRAYRTRRLALFAAIENQLGRQLSFVRPAGGLAVWTHIRAQVSAVEWARSARDHGVIVQPAQSFFLDGRDRPYFRLGYARLLETEISEAIKRLRCAFWELNQK